MIVSKIGFLKLSYANLENIILCEQAGQSFIRRGTASFLTKNLPVIRKLAKLGFSENDMTLTLGFPPEEVRSVLEEKNGVADAC